MLIAHILTILKIKFFIFIKIFEEHENELKEFTKNNSHDFLSFVTNFPNFKDY